MNVISFFLNRLEHFFISSMKVCDGCQPTFIFSAPINLFYIDKTNNNNSNNINIKNNINNNNIKNIKNNSNNNNYNNINNIKNNSNNIKNNSNNNYNININNNYNSNNYNNNNINNNNININNIKNSNNNNYNNINNNNINNNLNNNNNIKNNSNNNNNNNLCLTPNNCGTSSIQVNLILPVYKNRVHATCYSDNRGFSWHMKNGEKRQTSEEIVSKPCWPWHNITLEWGWSPISSLSILIRWALFWPADVHTVHAWEWCEGLKPVVHNQLDQCD